MPKTNSRVIFTRAAFGMEANLQTNPDPEFVDKARKVFQTPLWIRFFSMFPFWEYFGKYVNILQNRDYFLGLARSILEQRQQQDHSGVAVAHHLDWLVKNHSWQRQ